MRFRGQYADMADADLVARITQGDEEAFRQLLDRHQDAVYGFAKRFIGDAHEAADIAQETFLRLYRVAGNYRPGASFRSYLFRIARNLCIDFMRKKRPVSMEPLPETIAQETPLGHVERVQMMSALMAAIDDLPENQRAAILLRHDQGFCYQEISEAMGLTVSAVESLLVRARRNLRQKMTVDSAT